MKNILVLFVCLLVGFVSVAQTAIGYADKPATIATVDTDYTLTNAVANSYLFYGRQDYPTTQDYTINLDTLVSGQSNVAVALYGRKNSYTAWVQIGSTVNWTATTADTTITISNATKNRYREYKPVITGTGTGTCTIDYQELKLYLE